MSVVFHSKSGPLTVTRTGAGYVLNFPARPSERLSAPLPGLSQALSSEPVEVFVNAFNYMVVLASASEVRRLAPDMGAVARFDRPGVIVTAAGDGGYDCVSRYFAPAKGIPEDLSAGGRSAVLLLKAGRGAEVPVLALLRVTARSDPHLLIYGSKNFRKFKACGERNKLASTLSVEKTIPPMPIPISAARLRFLAISLRRAASCGLVTSSRSAILLGSAITPFIA